VLYRHPPYLIPPLANSLSAACLLRNGRAIYDKLKW
jgi:hypothetical protein